jgi:phage-related holin
VKNVGLKILLAVAVVFAPIQGMLGAALALIVLDLITGILASRKRQEPLSSSGLQRTIVKLVVYEVSIAAAFIAQHYLLNDSLPCANIMASFVGITELKSVLENMNDISGQDLLKTVIDKLGSSNKI